MNFSDAIRSCFSKYADFSGTASRPEYWWFALFATLVYLCLFIVAAAFRSPAVFILALGLILPSLAVQVRRLRDGGFSGWLAFLNLVPYVGSLVILVFMCLPSKPQVGQVNPYAQQNFASYPNPAASYCPSCGSVHQPNLAFCPSCGTSLRN